MKTRVEILIDVSSSMAEILPGNKQKMELAKEVLLDKILPKLDYADTIGVRLFGGHCSMVGEVENIPQANISLLRDFILNKIPQPYGSTPLALAIRTSVDHLKQEADAVKEIYLVTDGEETCDGDVMAAADYAASSGIECRIHIIGIGELSPEAQRQFEGITTRTGGKNINIARKGVVVGGVDRELSNLFHAVIDEVVKLIDTDYARGQETFRYYEERTIRDYLMRKSLPLNYIPGDPGAACHRLLVIEFYDDDISNLIRGIEHVIGCKGKNKEVLILMADWESRYHSRMLQSWYDQFKLKGIRRFCIKIEGLKGCQEIKTMSKSPLDFL
ncbi:MAG: VWA domain-containing protein [Sediminibacterium sp.]|nr:VWA domain-containing protein [Sediminibacterium sp.]